MLASSFWKHMHTITGQNRHRTTHLILLKFADNIDAYLMFAAHQNSAQNMQIRRNDHKWRHFESTDNMITLRIQEF